MFEASKIVYQNNQWISFVFLAVFMALTAIKLLYKERLFQSTTLFFSKKYLSIYFNKEKHNIFNIYQSLLFFVQIATISLIFFLLNEEYLFWGEHDNFKVFILIFVTVLDYFCLRYLAGLFFAHVLNLQQIYDRIVYEKVNYFNNVVLWVLPFLLIAYYTPVLKHFIFNSTFVFFIVLLIFRYALILYNNKMLIFNYLFYFILYLCALEIAPLVIILKLSI